MKVIEQYERACKTIKKYSEMYNVQVEINKLYALYPNKIDNTIPIMHAWPDTWPGAYKPGVYIFLGEHGEILYVGKAANIGSRFGEYFKHVDYPRNTNCLIKYDSWSIEPFFVIIVNVKPERPYEVSSLEGFLIKELKPTDNSVGI